MPDEPVFHELDYAPPPPWYEWRVVKVLKWCLIIAMVGLLLWWAWKASPGEWVRFLYWKHRFENYAPPIGREVYSTDPPVIRRMLAGGPNYSCMSYQRISGIDKPLNAIFVPEEWSRLQLYFDPPNAWENCAIFMHSRTHPTGGERLLAVRFTVIASGDSWHGATSTTDAIDPASIGIVINAYEFDAEVLTESGGKRSFTSKKTIAATIVVPFAEPFTLMAGQTDPSAASRFTVNYTAGGIPGVLEGQLQDDDTVTMRVRSGPLKFCENDYPYQRYP